MEHKSVSTTYLLLGSNLGDRHEQLASARTLISKQLGQIQGQSSVYETSAWGAEDQPAFFNQVLRASTTLPPLELLARAKKIEYVLGRRASRRWGPRAIDIDILYYDHINMASDALTIPHPRLHLRRFTLVPLNEIAPEYVHPGLQKSNLSLLNACEDDLAVTLAPTRH